MGLSLMNGGPTPLSSAVIEIGGILIRAESERKKWSGVGSVCFFAGPPVLSVC